VIPQPLSSVDSRADPDRIVVEVDPDMAELIPLFLANRHDDLAAIDAALRRADHALIRRLGHSMKGTGAAYGFDAITEIGAQLEQAARDEDAAAIRRWTDELTAYLARVEVA
jgi:HPt (histidine-containing phosphotransfer) domain-containing protein